MLTIVQQKTIEFSRQCGIDIRNNLQELMVKLDTQISCLKFPSIFPEAYTESIKECNRRIKFAKIFEREKQKLLDFVHADSEKRKMFREKYTRILPPKFIPTLLNNSPEINILYKKDVDAHLPKVDEEEYRVILEYPSDNGSAEFDNKMKYDIKKDAESIKAKLIEMQNELEIQKQDHVSIVNSLNNKIGELENVIQTKQVTIDSIDKEYAIVKSKINDRENEIEKLGGLIKDMTNNLISEKEKGKKELEKKEQEIHNLLVDIQNNQIRKKNCALCGEGLEFKGVSEDYIKDINTIMASKNKTIEDLESKVLKTEKIMSLMNRSMFDLMAKKLNNKENKLQQIKQDYEKNLEGHEDSLVSEQEKCRVVLKEINERNNEKVTKIKQEYEQEIKSFTAKVKDCEKIKNSLEAANSRFINDYNSISQTNACLKVSIENLKKELQEKIEISNNNEKKCSLLQEQITNLSFDLEKEKKLVIELKDNKNTMEQKIKNLNNELSEARESN